MYTSAEAKILTCFLLLKPYHVLCLEVSAISNLLFVEITNDHRRSSFSSRSQMARIIQQAKRKCSWYIWPFEF